ncbi:MULTISPECIES: polyprenyl synthetase family protein [Lactobacillus]|mgnify:FL=1|jgi:heptaprenyl diphosphate synthase|uniref:Polyprenyl synthetase family protein n=1 Tax=Lactobacillus paragasseri TaxID=2107999 RepID=A0AAW6XMS2_9LACO|nr:MULTISPECIES: polyprenyl synthetase family protein [Lactobacillus]MCQ5245979.1 polyprenyl synthetase family protein [Lactobacillus gasseri]MDK6868094.1 polyprenyl synthetase family protein [Lactobacillus paragasseri]OOK88545.1 hexaprenyltranstransferase [Lactobacillus gasseri]TVV00857.1 polyprenyl synthetase family protein [Lactobacillus paragasseri]VEF34774.1 geranylgeranyl pyrophosphate synthase [Lactobacillus paragasseri]
MLEKRNNIKNKFTFWDSFPQVQKDIIEINQIILKHVNSVPGLLGQALEDTFAVPGKMLRPACVMLFGAFGPDATQKHDELQKIATSIETLHNATLIHDDIIDESSMRHGRPSIQTKYGKHIAVYAGDYLFALSLTLLSENAQSLHSVIADGKTMQNILVGETEQYNNAYNINISEKEYLNQIKGKTGVLFGLACFIGAYESGIKVTKALKAKQFGEYLGQAFQLRDDILDYTTTSSTFKKPVLLDVKDGIYSGPLIFALQNDDNNHLHELVKMRQDLTQDQLHEIENLVNHLGGVERSQKLADQYTEKALASLKKHWPDNENRALIEQLTGRLLKRQY